MYTRGSEKGLTNNLFSDGLISVKFNVPVI